jgi:DNA-directed RNA polymerase specialized sigma24 family protein
VSWSRARSSRARHAEEWAESRRPRRTTSDVDRVLARVDVERYLRPLDDTDRALLTCYYLLELTSAQVGDELGMAASSVRCRLMHLRRAVRGA